VTTVAQNAIDAVTLGSLYALFALGIALIFGVMRLANFAHGELIMVGGYSLVVFERVSWPLKLLLTCLVVVIFALAMERAAFRPLRGSSPATLLVASFALSYGLQNLAALIFSTTPKATNLSTTLTQPFRISTLVVPRLDVVTVSVVVAMLVGLAAFLSWTRTGVQMRAAAEDFGMARLLGVRANVVIAVAFAISGLLAAVAAMLLVTQSGQVQTTMGTTAVVFGFVATVIGGIGSLWGAVLGGYLLGALSVVFQASLPLGLRPFRDALVFLAILVLLIVRPRGLVASRTAVVRV
jgi:branched-chain amino acid transport system permease protein